MMDDEPVLISDVGTFQKRFGVWECQSSDQSGNAIVIRIWDCHPDTITDLVTGFFAHLPTINDQCLEVLLRKHATDLGPVYAFWQSSYAEMFSRLFPTGAKASDIMPDDTWHATELKTIGFFQDGAGVQIKLDRAFRDEPIDQLICFEIDGRMNVTDMSVES